MGYLFAVKGYKLLDLQTKQIFISRDVVFHELVFPFNTSISLPAPSPTSSIPLITPTPFHFSPQHSDISPVYQHSQPFPSSSPPIFPPTITQPISSSPPHQPSIPSPPPPPPPLPRRSTRPRHAPKFLQDFHYQQQALTSSTVPPRFCLRS